MSTPFNAVAAAYNNAVRLVNDGASPAVGDFGARGAAAAAGQVSDFSKLVTDSMQSVIDAGATSDRLSMDLVNGKSNIVDVVTAISQTELAMQSMVAVRDKVIMAYEEIMRMPI